MPKVFAFLYSKHPCNDLRKTSEGKSQWNDGWSRLWRQESRIDRAEHHGSNSKTGQAQRRRIRRFYFIGHDEFASGNFKLSSIGFATSLEINSFRAHVLTRGR